MSTRPGRADARASTRREARARPPRAPRKSEEAVTQVTLKMRESLHRELARRAFNSGMTMRGYIMRALKQAGLHVTEADLLDRRKQPRRR